MAVRGVPPPTAPQPDSGRREACSEAPAVPAAPSSAPSPRPAGAARARPVRAERRVKGQRACAPRSGPTQTPPGGEDSRARAGAPPLCPRLCSVVGPSRGPGEQGTAARSLASPRFTSPSGFRVWGCPCLRVFPTPPRTPPQRSGRRAARGELGPPRPGRCCVSSTWSRVCRNEVLVNECSWRPDIPAPN